MKFRWGNSTIECENAEDRGPILILINGLIRHDDGSVSKFDRLVLTRDEVEERKNEGGGRRPPRRRSPK
jgi:hypothetical protein